MRDSNALARATCRRDSNIGSSSFRTAIDLGLGYETLEQLFRRMTFNVLAVAERYGIGTDKRILREIKEVVKK